MRPGPDLRRVDAKQHIFIVTSSAEARWIINKFNGQMDNSAVREPAFAAAIHRNAGGPTKK
jgi:hypothetical protein